MNTHPVIILAAAVAVATVYAGEKPVAATPAAVPTSAWEKLNNWQAGPFGLGLHMHALGGVSTDEPALLGTGGHDPQREEPTIQALEPALNLRTKYVEGFTNSIWFQDAEGDWNGEWEEAFLKVVELPFGLSLKGGQFLPHFGAQNDRHLHAWDFVDSEMPLSTFLGEHGLMLRGGQLDWTLPLDMDPVFTTVLSLAYGETPPDEHDHAHAGHGEEGPFEGHEATPANDILTARWLGRYRWDDFHSLTGGVSWVRGDNGFDRRTDVAGLDVEFLWRENGLEPGGRAFRWRNELLWRDVEARADGHGHDHEAGHDTEDPHHEEGPVSGTFNELGLYSTVHYSWNEHLDTGLRLAWMEGIREFGQDERLRVSPVVSWWFDTSRRAGLRFQYNFDHLDGRDEHSAWLQVNLALGATDEVR